MSDVERRATSLVRIGAPNESGLTRVRAYRVADIDDGKKFDIDKEPLDPLADTCTLAWEANTAKNHIIITRSHLIAPDTQHMWFVRMDSRRQGGDSTHAVVAFATDHFTDGTIINEMEFVLLPVHNEDQVGAITWNRTNGEIEQLYVSPELRRQNIAQRLINAAAAVHHTHRWPGVMHASGKRTALGQQFVLSLQNPLRISRHSELSPPMDPH